MHNFIVLKNYWEHHNLIIYKNERSFRKKRRIFKIIPEKHHLWKSCHQQIRKISLFLLSNFIERYHSFLFIKKKCIFKGKIDGILQYLKTNKSFKNYNKFVYAYRINQQIAPFVTQNEVSSEEVLLHTSFNFLNKHKQ